MRRQHFLWTYLVFAIVLAMYGSFSLFYSLSHEKPIPTLTILFLITSGIMFVILIVLVIVGVFSKSKEPVVDQPNPNLYTTEKVENLDEIYAKPEQKEEKPAPRREYQYREDTEYRSRKSRYDDDPPLRKVTYERSSSTYINRIGEGLILRVNGNRIYDMRTNTYYRIEGNQVTREGYGPVFEINGNRIREAFGNYLYELSGGNVNKVYGGYFASISGGYLTTYDSREKYEIGSSLSAYQILAVVALLFGSY